MSLADLHAQRRANVSFMADAIRQLNEAEAAGSSQVAGLRDYYDRCLEKLRRDACPCGCVGGVIDGILPGLSYDCPLHKPEANA